MKRSILLICSVFLFSMALMGCQSKKEETKKNTVEELLTFKDSYIGDSSSVVNLSYLLPGGKYVKRVSLQTDKKPYGITIDYGIKEGSNIKGDDFEDYWNEEVTQRAFLNNATTYFILIQNVDEVEFKLYTTAPKSFKVTRKQIDDFYGKDVRKFAEDEKAWNKEVLEDTIGDDAKLKEFFKNHPIQS
ncbi:DUF4825 domain-containing protein [Bacillus massiliigorillae]|uniref:DUF4825 domain-containing protein n=1 Tax=Bacillus massiliigorillae TaxID=1243664 RepID=UPI0003A7A3B5|nr:DUF4825 domain-containing protein [Bacillus massiliigorillae]